MDRAGYQRIELRSHVALPVLVAGELVAVLGFATLREERTWSDELVGRLRLVAEIFASALARKRAHDDVERALGFERLLVDISATLLRGRPGDLDAAITAALRDIGEFLRVERVLLRSLDADGSRFDTTHLWVASGVDAPPYVIDRATAPVLFERVSSGRVVALSSLDELPPEADTDRELLRRLGIRSGLVVPLAVDGLIVGALSLSSVRAERVWPEILIPRVQLIGEVFASVLTRQRHATQMRDAQSETAQYRERLAHLVRVHTVGEMSAAIAHEVNQPLMAIENYALAARRRLAAEGAHREREARGVAGKDRTASGPCGRCPEAPAVDRPEARIRSHAVRSRRYDRECDQSGRDGESAQRRSDRECRGTRVAKRSRGRNPDSAGRAEPCAQCHRGHGLGQYGRQSAADRVAACG